MGKISELINEQIVTALKGSIIISPRFTDYRVADVLNLENPDIEAEIKKLLEDSPSLNREPESEQIKKDKEIESFTEKVKAFDNGPVGELNQFTSAQFSNVRGFATNPVQFIISSVFRKMSRGLGVVALAAVFFEIVKFIINELLKPGRLLDRRFKRDIENEFLAFRSREEKQKIRQGFSNYIVTTIGGLRGGMGQVTSSRGLIATGGITKVINTTFSEPNTQSAASGVDIKIARGQGKPKSVFVGG